MIIVDNNFDSQTLALKAIRKVRKNALCASIALDEMAKTAWSNSGKKKNKPKKK